MAASAASGGAERNFKSQTTNHKYQINHNDKNSKSKS
jgi:hypothetical protein